MQKAVTDERNRVILILFVAAITGWVVGQLPWVLAITGIGIAAHAIWRGSQLLHWLHGGAKPPPAHTGLWAEVYSQMRRERRSSDSRRRKLLEMLRWYSDSSDALPDAAIILDEHNTIIGSNQAARQTLGIDNKRDRGQRVDNLLRDPLLLTLLNDELAEPVIETASPVNVGDTVRFRLTTYGAGTRLLVAQDISEQIRSQETRQAFVANVSHELHTPLTVINGHLELLIDEPDLHDAHREQLQQVAAQSQRMQAIVQDLLSLARLESAPSLSDGESLHIAQLIQQEIDTLLSSGQFSEHQILCDLDHNLQLLGRETEMHSVIHNLLFNALRYTPAGSTIQVQWSRLPNGKPALRVSDNGPGISAEHLPHLTERFYRVDPSHSSSTGGTGLGLAIVKHVLQRHGGELQITSTEGEGCEFQALCSADRAVF